MPRLIDADKLNVRLSRDATPYYTQCDIDAAPTIDPESLRQKGEWFVLDECSNAGVYCSVCHKKVFKECYANVKEKSNFCPNCGADMRGDT